MWTLAYHQRIPERIRNEVSRWGMCKDEFEEGNGWQNQLYVREARRMISDYVMTQDICEGLRVAEDVVGLAAYGMDSHNVQRYVTGDSFVRNNIYRLVLTKKDTLLYNLLEDPGQKTDISGTEKETTSLLLSELVSHNTELISGYKPVTTIEAGFPGEKSFTLPVQDALLSGAVWLS